MTFSSLHASLIASMNSTNRSRNLELIFASHSLAEPAEQ